MNARSVYCTIAVKYLVDLSKLWPWLPHFRVVAEYENLSKASRAFGISPAALSKAIQSLEKIIGKPLFTRTTGTLRLNEQGRALLRSIRASMRDIDDVVSAIRLEPSARTLRVAAPAHWVHVLFPMPERTVSSIVSLPPQIANSLVRGEVDLCLHEALISAKQIHTIELASFESRYVVGPNHVLARQAACTIDQLALHPHCRLRFPDAGGTPATDMNANLARTLLVDTVEQLIAATTSGPYVANLPKPLASVFGLTVLNVAHAKIPRGSLYGSMREASKGDTGSLQPWFAAMSVRLQA